MKEPEAASVEMICSVSELANLFHQGQDLRGFLSQVVQIVSKHMQADVCSIYLFNEQSEKLILQATAGLNSEMVGTLTLNTGEGLTGLALKELRPIREGRGRDNPYFKPIPGSGEEKYESFLAVPIIRGIRRVGVLVLQDEKRSRFSKGDALALKAIASQLAATLENAQLLMERPRRGEHPGISWGTGRLIRGTQVVEGVALGEAYQMEGPGTLDHRLYACDDAYRDTLDDFRRAIDLTEQQLEELQNRLEQELADVASLIFSAHLLMLRDQGFSGTMEDRIADGARPCDAILSVANEYIDIFTESENSRMREKVLDIKDLGHRILKNLTDEEGEHGDYDGQIVLTNELLPSELLKLAAQKVEGIVLFGGGATAHVTVLAQSLQVPLIYTEDESIFRIPANTPLALDANQGILLVYPDESAIKRIRQLKEGTDRIAGLAEMAKPESYTKDGERIYLRATVNLLSDLKLARQLKAEGIGLYRSEFPFLIRSDFPSEEEQFRIYKKVVNGLEDPLVTLRTLDVGGDKILSYIPESQEEANPFLGLRAIRFLLENKKVFVGQLKAMIRAGRSRPIRILFPLISSLDDFQNAKIIVQKSLNFLKRDGLGQYPMPKLGAMIELPSAVEMAPELAREADFLSLGTNDLVQYMLGVDRTNEKVADLFDVRHPAVLRAVKRVADSAKEADCPLSVCGIMAKDPKTVHYLIGLGVREFSLEAAKIPEMQEAVSRMDLKKAQSDAAILSRLGTLHETREFMQEINERSEVQIER
ncbi:MAG: phosphoenolpyruvate--protein phosphotransferase [Spirochaetaceae bacterium]|nr:phosphoenolpyruvate--protein phosphotransferase [Spirochaetaceae bacterium]MDT8297575.1 phosphoenolpyruvate--protein phosphotransferase [Spirochaetaceae bacterium]